MSNSNTIRILMADMEVMRCDKRWGDLRLAILRLDNLVWDAAIDSKEKSDGGFDGVDDEDDQGSLL